MAIKVQLYGTSIFRKVSLHIVKEKLSKTLAKLKPVIISAVSYLA